MSGLRLLGSVPVRNRLGECVLWDERSQRVWWTDIEASRLYRCAADGADLEAFELPERLAAFGFVQGDSRLICAFASGFALYDVQSGRRDWLFRPEQGWQGTRFNDGRVDRQGRFWSGTMVEGDARDRAGRGVKGSLYVLAGGCGRRVFGDIEISNSLCFSADGGTLYFADSPTRQILAFAMDPESAALASRRVFATIAGNGVPDGSVVDADGYVWNAEWGGARLVRYAPSGDVDCEIPLPVTQPTCLCFGGPDLDRIFVSTATEGLGTDALAVQPEAGKLLIYHTAYRGLPEPRYRA